MGYKIVCLKCRKAFSNNLGYKHNFGKCQECGSDYIYYNHKFRPPKRDNLKAWKVVSFLYQHGFTFQHVDKEYIKTRQYGYMLYDKYPTNLKDAKSFVAKYKKG